MEVLDLLDSQANLEHKVPRVLLVFKDRKAILEPKVQLDQLDRQVVKERRETLDLEEVPDSLDLKVNQDNKDQKVQ